MLRIKDCVRFSQVGEDRRMTIPAIVDAMQDCSCRHSESVGVGIDFLKERHRAWLLEYWQIVIDRIPEECQEFEVETRAWKFIRFFGHRNFALYDTEGKAMVKANSVWFYVDTDRMRPVRPEREDLEPYGVDEPLAMDYAPNKKVKVPENMEERESFPVLRAHLDANHHVNNGKYIQMACEYLPEDMDIREVRVEYRLAAKYGDRIYPRVGCDEEGNYVVSLGMEDGSPYAVVMAMPRR